MLKVIAFDLWETLITDTPDISRAQERLRLDRMERILSERGLTVTAKGIEHAYRKMWHQCHERYWSQDEDVPCRRQIEHFLEALELDPEAFEEPWLAALEDAYANAAIEVLPLLVDGADGVVRHLKARGYRIGLISNTGRTPGYALREILDRLGLAPSFEVMVFSNERGTCKPRPAIFETLRDALDVACEEMLFVGDNLYVDVHGAQRIGMRAVHFEPSVRGTAIAPTVDHGLEIVPDATITDLRELLEVVEAMNERTAIGGSR